MPELRNTIIYLIGIPAVGKYSTARAIARLTGAKVVDNQLINIPIFSLAGYDGTDAFAFPPDGWKSIEKIRQAVLTFIRDHADRNASFIFTNVLEATAGEEKLFRKIERLARHRGAAFYPVWLTCDAAEIRKRKNNPDRRKRFKDIDLTNIKFWTEKFKVLDVPHPNAMTIDTTHSKPAVTAKRILKHIEDRRSFPTA
jgi:predicted kinase